MWTTHGSSCSLVVGGGLEISVDPQDMSTKLVRGAKR